MGPQCMAAHQGRDSLSHLAPHAEDPAKANKAGNDEAPGVGGGHEAIQSKLDNQADKENTLLTNNNFLSQPMSAKEQNLFGFLIWI